jgi:hypothetical protein
MHESVAFLPGGQEYTLLAPKFRPHTYRTAVWHSHKNFSTYTGDSSSYLDQACA